MNKTFVKQAVGPRGDKMTAQINEDIRKKKQILAKQRQDQARYFEQKEAKEKEELDLRRRIQVEVSKKGQLEDDPAADKAEIKRKEQAIKNLKNDLKAKRKENEQLQKNYEDEQNKNKKNKSD